MWSTSGFVTGTSVATTDRARLADRLTSSVADLVDAVVVFPSLSTSALEDIVIAALDQMIAHAAERGVEIVIGRSVASTIVRNAPRSAGARPLRRLVDSLVEQPIASKMLSSAATKSKITRIVVASDLDTISVEST